MSDERPDPPNAAPPVQTSSRLLSILAALGVGIAVLAIGIGLVYALLFKLPDLASRISQNPEVILLAGGLVWLMIHRRQRKARQNRHDQSR